MRVKPELGDAAVYAVDQAVGTFLLGLPLGAAAMIDEVARGQEDFAQGLADPLAKLGHHRRGRIAILLVLAPDRNSSTDRTAIQIGNDRIQSPYGS